MNEIETFKKTNLLIVQPEQTVLDYAIHLIKTSVSTLIKVIGITSMLIWLIIW